MVLGCLLFRLFRARLCSFRSSAFPLAHSLLFRSPLLASARPARLCFSPLASVSARLSALSHSPLLFRHLLFDACFLTHLCLLALSQEQPLETRKSYEVDRVWLAGLARYPWGESVTAAWACHGHVPPPAGLASASQHEYPRYVLSSRHCLLLLL